MSHLTSLSEGFSEVVKETERQHERQLKKQEEFERNIKRVEGYLEHLATSLQEGGVKTKNMNLNQLVQKVGTELSRHYENEKEVQAAGYRSVSDLLRRDKKQLTRTEGWVNLLPEKYREMPVRLALDKSNLELGRVERTFKRVQKQVLCAFEEEVPEEVLSLLDKQWSELEDLSDLEHLLSDLLRYNGGLEPKENPETSTTSELNERLLESGFKLFPEIFTEQVVSMTEKQEVQVPYQECKYRKGTNPNHVMKFVLWQHLMPDEPELLCERLLYEFTMHLSEQGRAFVPSVDVTPHVKDEDKKQLRPTSEWTDCEWSSDVELTELTDFARAEGFTLVETSNENCEEEEEGTDELQECLRVLAL